jgi:HD-GYP domain-containing protein (c-di-GMP phosphodiesterase class II)
MKPDYPLATLQEPQDDWLSAQDGISDLSPDLQDEVRDTIRSITMTLSSNAAGLCWRDDVGQVHWLVGTPHRDEFLIRRRQEFFRRPPRQAFHIETSFDRIRCLAVPLRYGYADFRLCIEGAPPRLSPSRLEMASMLGIHCLRLVRSSRQLVRIHSQSASLAAVSDMLSTVLEAAPVEDMLARLAEKIAKATSSESVSIDSFDSATSQLQRNLYTDPSWPDWEQAAKRWRELIEIRVRESANSQGVPKEWRGPLVVPDLQNPMVLAGLPREESDFYVQAGLRTVILQPLWVGEEFVGVLSVNNRQLRQYSEPELDVLSRMADVAAVAIKGAQLMQQLGQSRERERHAYRESIYRLAAAAEARDHTTGIHLENLQHSVRLLSEELSDDRRFIAEVTQASRMHDIGKISVPDSILLKSGPLTEAEMEIMKKHTIEGEHLLVGHSLVTARQVARSHHERWDGRGYPDGLAGEEIPLAARIVAVADVYDALISIRPYKKAWPRDQALAEILAGNGTQFDPTVLEAFRKLHVSGALGSAMLDVA